MRCKIRLHLWLISFSSHIHRITIIIMLQYNYISLQRKNFFNILFCTTAVKASSTKTEFAIIMQVLKVAEDTNLLKFQTGKI